MLAETHYARSGDVHIAYQVFGRGAVDIVCVPGIISHLEHFLDDPSIVRYYERLSTFARVITFDKRGTGMSDRDVSNQSLDDRMDDIRAVMDAVGSECAAIFGFSEGGAMSATFAATYPERTRALILYGATSRYGEKFAATWSRYVDTAWGSGGIADLAGASMAGNKTFREWVARLERLAYSPSAAKAIGKLNEGLDIRHVLPAIRSPTLVIHRTDDRMVGVESGRYLGKHIPGAQYLEFPGIDHVPWLGDMTAIVDAIEEFLTGSVADVDTERVLATVMFADISDSTKKAASLGDKAWHEVLDRFHAVLAREVNRGRGRVIKSTGDGLLATFDGPARSVRCALAMRDAVIPLDLTLKVGLHTGEIELMGDDIGGIAVHIAARIAALAGAGEILTSNTVKDLVSGSGLHFLDRGQHQLKGLEDPYRLSAVGG